MINENYDESLLDLGEALYHSYVGKSSHVLTLVFISNNRIALITYIPLLNQAEFAIWEQTDEIKEDLLEFIAEGALKTACEDGYYKNDVEEMLSTIELLADLFN